jgi:hypothetical protein
MRAVLVYETGSPDVLRYEEAERGNGELLVTVLDRATRRLSHSVDQQTGSSNLQCVRSWG